MSRQKTIFCAAVLALTGCTSGGVSIPDSTGQHSGASAALPEPVVLRCPYKKQELIVEVGPILRISDQLSALPLKASDLGQTDLDREWSAGYTLMYGTQGGRGVRLIDPEAEQARESVAAVGTADADAVRFRGDTVGTFFGAVAARAQVVMIPTCGVALNVPVVAAPPEELRAKWQQLADKAYPAPDLKLGEPLDLGIHTTSVNNTVETRTQGTNLEVSFSSDALFAYNSAELNAQARNILADVAKQLSSLSSGKMIITGHTDATGEASTNLELSRRRAESVWAELSITQNLGAFQVEVIGRGESEPRAVGDSEAARAANRRVEISVQGSKNAERMRSSDRVADSNGPTGTAETGVELTHDGKTLVSVSLPRVRKVGRLLIGDITLKAGSSTKSIGTYFSTYSSADKRSDAKTIGTYTTTGLTLLQDGQRIHPLDYRSPYHDGKRLPLTEVEAFRTMEPGDQMVLTAVWPDVGANQVVLDQPDPPLFSYNLPFRITGIPVS